MSRMFERLGRSELAVGAFWLFPSPELVEIAGFAGLDFACMDMMFTSMGWETVAQMIRAARQHNMTPMVRLQGYPWAGQADASRIADAARALSIGAEGVILSVDSPEEVEAVLKVARDEHRLVYIHRQHHFTDHAAWQAYEDRLARETLIMPLVESPGAARQLEAILSVEGVRGIFLGMGDLSRALGHANDRDHPEVRAFVRRAIELARRRDVWVFVNAGRKDSLPDLVKDVAQLRELGVSAVFINYGFIFQRIYERSLAMIRREAKAASG